MKNAGRLLLLVLVIGAGIYFYPQFANTFNDSQQPASPTDVAIKYRFSVDREIRNNVYTAYFNYSLHEPLYVSYTLYQGGGDCSRKHMHFKKDDVTGTASLEDYKHSLYDEGHLCNAEDEAFDCEREEQTFRFYNCLPQTPKLNRGVWKTWESQVRAESQRDSLLVLCGGIFGDRRIGQAAVPDTCWKLVYNLTTGRILHCLTFPNDDSNTAERISIEALKQKVGYPLQLPSFK
jgi:endonuclease G